MICCHITGNRNNKMGWPDAYVEDKIWLVSFMDYDIGFFDEEQNRVEPMGENPFAPKVLPMSPV